MEQKEKSLAPFKKDLGKPGEKGSLSYIHRYGETPSGTPVIIKQGKTDYSFPLSKHLDKFLSLNRRTVSRIFERFLGPDFKIEPDFDFVKNGVAEYALMSRYFRDGTNSESQEKRDELVASLQDEKHPFFHEIKEVLGDDESVGETAQIIRKHKAENFMPREIGAVIGHPENLSREKAVKLHAEGKKLPSTYFIVQEAIEGKNLVPLLEIKDEQLAANPKTLEKLLMFTLLAKMMYSGKDGKLIDTRAEEVLKHPFEWFQKTANVLVDTGSGEKNRVMFVDNRWLYDKNSRIAEGGINFVKFLCVGSIDRAIKKYFDLLKSQKK